MTEIVRDASASHKFATGSKVRLNGSGFLRFAVPGLYEVLARLPERQGKCQYRIKSVSEPYQRVVSEDELEAE